MKRRLLIVTSSYYPAMIADMHRARHLAWELPALGWDVEVLAPGASFQTEVFLDAESKSLFNPSVPFHDAQPGDFGFLRLLGMRSMSWRALWPLYQTGKRILRERTFDLVFITTGKFNFFCLGRLWRWKFGTPYVLDFHDPWVKKGKTFKTTKHVLKLKVAQWLARPLESFAVRGASGVIAVSPLYLDQLIERHGNLDSLQASSSCTSPFSASARDLCASGLQADADLTDASTLDISYVGAGGAIMSKSFETICAHLRQLRKEDQTLLVKVRIRLFGTYALWAAGDPKPLEALAREYGLDDVITEEPRWIGYTEAMKVLTDSAGLLVLGVDDAGYMPSKLFTYALSGKPILACMRIDSPAAKYFEHAPELGHLISYSEERVSVSPSGLAEVKQFILEVKTRRNFDRAALIAENTAPEMAKSLSTLFDRVVERSRRSA